MRAQQAALQQELTQLQAEMAQASQSVASLHSQAAQQRQELATLQQQREAEEARIKRPEVAREQAAAEAEQAAANQQQQPGAAAAQVAVAPPQAAGPTQTAQESEPLPLPPPVPPAPPPIAAPAPRAVAARVPYGGPRDARVETQDEAQAAEQSDNAAIQSVLGRLRQQARNVPPPSAAAPADVAADNGYGEARPGTAAYGQPRQVDPRSRLGMARAALAAGNVESARQYLEEAQLQLVFRPVTPGDDTPQGSSQAAGDVAQALSMLGAGDSGAAMQYINRAMGEDRPGGDVQPPLQASGQFAPYGNAPVAEAGQ